jgi:phage terminase large subunit GpA-like protein
VLLCDEADAMEATAEGNPIRLGERRTLTFANRKIIVGSTPIFEDSSAVLRAYGESDQRVFEVQCPRCGAFAEIMWANITWPEGKPEEAEYECPHCKAHVGESEKPGMVAAGQWRATKPQVRGHAGFRLNALVSLLANASWGTLAVEFIAAKSDPAELQTFTNTILAQGWSTPAMISDSALAARAEPFDLQAIPHEVLFLTAGADVQDDRVELSIIGWTRDGVALVLAHFTIWGSFQDGSTWDELDQTLRTRWRHPLGGVIRIDAACIDAGDGDHFDHVLNFCYPRMNRRVFASKGMYGARPAFQLAKGKKIGDKLALIGVDGLKNQIFDRLQRARGIRFSGSLEPVYYEQLASERRVVRYQRGQPIRRFERTGRTRNEALDCLVYAFAARQAIRDISLDRRVAELKGQPIERRPISDYIAGIGHPTAPRHAEQLHRTKDTLMSGRILLCQGHAIEGPGAVMTFALYRLLDGVHPYALEVNKLPWTMSVDEATRLGDAGRRVARALSARNDGRRPTEGPRFHAEPIGEDGPVTIELGIEAHGDEDRFYFRFGYDCVRFSVAEGGDLLNLFMILGEDLGDMRRAIRQAQPIQPAPNDWRFHRSTLTPWAEPQF